MALVRDLLLSVERKATEEAAGGALQGLLRELKDELPALEASLEALWDEERVRALGEAVALGALQALEREWQDGRLPLHGLIARLEVLADRGAELAHARAQRYARPRARGRLAAKGVVAGLIEQLHGSMPQLTGELRALTPIAEELGARIGKGVVGGLRLGVEEARAAGGPPAMPRLRLAVGEVADGVFDSIRRNVRGKGAALGALGLTAFCAGLLAGAHRGSDRRSARR